MPSSFSIYQLHFTGPILNSLSPPLRSVSSSLGFLSPSRGTITVQGGPSHGPCPSGALAQGTSRTLGLESGCEGQQARMGPGLLPCLQPAFAKRPQAMLGCWPAAPWLTSLPLMIVGPLHLSAPSFEACRRGLQAAVTPW